MTRLSIPILRIILRIIILRTTKNNHLLLRIIIKNNKNKMTGQAEVEGVPKQARGSALRLGLWGLFRFRAWGCVRLWCF